MCRCEGTPERPLFHPCICTGSIKFIHQDCLLQWLRYSKKEFCELCSHRFSFTPIYSPDMPKRLPLSIVFSGFLGTVAHAIRFWLHYTVVAIAWLGVVPLTACRRVLKEQELQGDPSPQCPHPNAINLGITPVSFGSS